MMCNVMHGDVLMHARTVCVHAVCASYVLMCMCLCMRARFVHDCCFFSSCYVWESSIISH